MPQAWLPMRVTSSHEARRFVRARGGTLYVTVDGVSTESPAGPVDVDGFDGGGYLLVYDRRLARPPELRVELVDGAPALARP